MNATDLPFGQLIDALRAAAEGIPATEAAVELLIAHNGDGHWLRREPFLRDVVLLEDDGKRYADVDWESLGEAARRPGNAMFDTDSEIGVLRVACSIARGWLGDALSSCDRGNVELIVDAVRHAGGAR